MAGIYILMAGIAVRHKKTGLNFFRDKNVGGGEKGVWTKVQNRYTKGNLRTTL